MADVSATIAALDALTLRVHGATRDAVGDAAHLFQAQSMRNAPVGQPGNSTNPGGDLARSIAVEGPIGSGGSYAALVGPTVTTAHPGIGGRVYNYGRLREFGGEIHPNVATYMVFKKFGVYAMKRSVFQEGALYLTRARADASVLAQIEVALQTRVAQAVTGA